MKKLFSGRQSALGVATGEYTLVLAGGALVCILGLTFLGGQIKNLFMFDFKSHIAVASPTTANPTTPAPASEAPLPTQAETTPATPAPTPDPVVAEAPAPSAYTSTKVFYDPKTGKIMMSDLSNASNSANTTGSDGTLGAIKMLEELKKSGVFLNDAKATNLFDQLIKTATTTHDTETSLKLPPSTTLNSPAYSEYKKSGFEGAYTNFETAYNNLMSYMQTSKMDSSVIKKVNDYSGIISSVAMMNVWSKYDYTLPASSAQTYIIGSNPVTSPLTLDMPSPDMLQ